MTDKERVLKGLECCMWSRQNVKPEKWKCDKCPYKDKNILNSTTIWQSCTNVLAKDASKLLKNMPYQQPASI